MNAHVTAYIEWLGERLPDITGEHVALLGWEVIRAMADMQELRRKHRLHLVR